MFSLWCGNCSKFQIKRKHLCLALILFLFPKHQHKDERPLPCASTRSRRGGEQTRPGNLSTDYKPPVISLRGSGAPPRGGGILTRGCVLQCLGIVRGVRPTYVRRRRPSHAASDNHQRFSSSDLLCAHNRTGPREDFHGRCVTGLGTRGSRILPHPMEHRDWSFVTITQLLGWG